MSRHAGFAVLGAFVLGGVAVGSAANDRVASRVTAAQTESERATAASTWVDGRAPIAAPVLLRMKSDSGVVGSYKFQTSEIHRLAYELAEDDPRGEFLSSATGPWNRTTEVALTMVSTARADAASPRYLVYWLGYRISGDEARSLSAMQWDSIFRTVGRRAVVHMTPTGQIENVQVSSDAVRPVGRSLAAILGGLALDLPADSVDAGAEWHGGVVIPVRRPDGTRTQATIRVRYLLRRFEVQPEGRLVRIEFDGEPAEVGERADSVSGVYFGEAIFAVGEGRFDRMRAEARLDVHWKPAGGLPASRSRTEWVGQFTRR